MNVPEGHAAFISTFKMHAPPKCWYPATSLRGVITQKATGYTIKFLYLFNGLYT